MLAGRTTIMSARRKLPLLVMIGSALRKWLSHLLLKRPSTKIKKRQKINILIVMTFVFQRKNQGAGWVQHTQLIW